MGELVVIVGPIASGKSTVASALGTRLRSAGRKWLWSISMTWSR